MPEAYLALARDYQRRTTLFEGWRELLVSRLGLRRGETVIDVGRGPGLNFAAPRAAVGPDGTIIAVEESPELLAVAARQVARRRRDNVELINARAASAILSVRADAALFAAVPELLSSPIAVANMVEQLRPGAAVAAGGWKLLADRVSGLSVSELGFGTGFLAHHARTRHHPPTTTGRHPADHSRPGTNAGDG